MINFFFQNWKNVIIFKSDYIYLENLEDQLIINNN